ncbi:MAG: hypothetical protein C0503_04270 [Gemmatimonas sp.]|nr:hypothetical protein [Gemmatimonas sp.]
MVSLTTLLRAAPRLLSAVLLLPTLASGQATPPLSPDSAIALAVRQHPEIAAARAALRAADADVRQASAFANPTLSWQYERTSAGSNTNSQHITTLAQPLALGRRRGRRGVAVARFDAATASLRAAELDVATRVIRAYAALGAAERQAAIARAGSEEFDRAMAALQARREAGDISGYELRRSRLEAARLAAQRAAREADVRRAQRTLAALLAPTPDDAIDATGLRVSLPTAQALREHAAALGRTAVGDSALDARPDVAAAAARVREAQAAADLAAWERVPVPSLVGGIKTERAAGLGTLNGIAAGVSIPLPLLDRRTAAAEAATADAAAADASFVATRQRARVEAHAALDALRTAQVQLDALAPALGDEATRAVDAARLAYTEGEITLDAWLLALRAFADAEDAYTSLLADALVLRAEAARALGRLPSWGTP